MCLEEGEALCTAGRGRVYRHTGRRARGCIWLAGLASFSVHLPVQSACTIVTGAAHPLRASQPGPSPSSLDSLRALPGLALL